MDILLFFFRQLVEAIAYIHSMGFCHRDLKLENLLFDSDFNVKITDFQFASEMRDADGAKKVFIKPIGTRGYMAPEMLSYVYRYTGDKADTFSLGVILFELFCGYPPFVTANLKKCKFYRALQGDGKGNRTYMRTFWKHQHSRKNIPKNHFDKSFKDLFHKLISHDPAKRISLEELKKHVWYNQPVASQKRVIEYMSQYKEKIKKCIGRY